MTHPTTEKMDPQLKAKWLEALRSGEYHQGHGELCEATDEGTLHCCLGVLAEVAGVPRARLYGKDTLSAHEIKRNDLLGPWDVPGDEPMSFHAIDPESHTTTQRKLAAMNDNGKPFSKIADWIEANL